MKTFRSDLSNIEFPFAERISAKTIRHAVLELIQNDYPQFTHDSFLSVSELNVYREKAVSEYLKKETGELTELEQKVISSVAGSTTITDKVESDGNQAETFGERIADKVASFGGSWRFIISFMSFIFLWIAANIYLLLNKGFDPYPFILLNLILSCIASLQAPVIMMSQNRQEDKDRERGRKDYMINLKSEIEVRTLHEKIDHMIMDQQMELIELQKIQIEMMNEILHEVRKENGSRPSHTKQNHE